MGFADSYPVWKPCDIGSCLPDIHGAFRAAHSTATKNHGDRLHTHPYWSELSGRALRKRSAKPLAILKFCGLTLMIGILFLRGHARLLTADLWPQAPVHLHAARFGIALIAILWAYEGWHMVSFTAGEFKNVQRDLPRGLLYGTLIVVVTYVLANFAYYC